VDKGGKIADPDYEVNAHELPVRKVESAAMNVVGGRYGAVLGVAGVRRLLVSSVLARMPLGMSSLAILLLVREHTGSFGQAGVTVGVFALAQAAASPVHGALIDRLGQQRILLPSAAGQATLLISLVLAARSGAPLVLLAVIGGLAGALVPAISACLRALWPAVAPGPAQREAAYSLDAISQETIWTLGPLAVGAVVAVGSPDLAVLLCGAVTLGGTLAFATSPLARQHAAGPAGHRRGRPLGSTGLRVLLLTTILMGVCVGAVEVGLPSLAFHLGSSRASGLMLSLWSVGSMLGGIWYGARRWRQPADARYPWLLLTHAISTAPLLVAGSVPAGVALGAIAGVAYAPTLACQMSLINDLAPAGAVTEAFTWSTAAIAAGIACGSAIAGFVAEGVGVQGTFAVGCAGAAAAAALAGLARRQLAPAAATAASES
jgi:MFS family permease